MQRVLRNLRQLPKLASGTTPRKKKAGRGHGWPGGRKVAGTGSQQTRFRSGKQGGEFVCDAKCDAISQGRVELLARAVLLVAGMEISESDRAAILARVVADAGRNLRS